MNKDYSVLIEETIEALKDNDSEIVGYYEDRLEALVIEAIEKVEAYCMEQFKTISGLFEFLNKALYDGSKSMELVKDWDFPAMQANGSYIEFTETLFSIFEDNLPYLLACGLLGAGRGLWEVFDDFPCLNTII